MAKKDKAPAAETPETDAAAPAATAEAPPKKEKKPREPKAKTAPAAPADKVPAAAAPPATTSPAAPGEPSSSKKKKQPGTPPRPGKKLRNHLKNMRANVEKEGVIPLKRAVQLLKQFKRAKFDETVEIHMSLGIDTTQNDQMVRGSVSLPNGLGKTVRVVVFCQGENITKAKEAGADHAGGDDIIEKIQKESWLDFDVALATQDMMGKVSRLGKTLGPRGLMPTPKAGTVVPAAADVAAAVKEFKAGKVEYRADKGGNVHARVGKMSFEEDKLVENITTFVEQIRAVKPAGVKGHYVKSITVSATQSLGVGVTV